MECQDIDSLLGEIRKKVVRGSKPTRNGRLKNCLRVIDPENPAKARETGTAVNVRQEDKETSMDLNSAITRFRGLAEANIPAPSVDKKNPDGSKQTSPKSKWDVGATGQKTYDSKSASVPSDKEAMAAADNSTAGVSGPGYGADGREKVDIRQEQIAIKIAHGDNRLATLIGDIYAESESIDQFFQLVEKYVGFDKLKGEIAKKGGAEDPGAVAAAIGRKKFGKEKFQAAAAAGKSMKGEEPTTEGEGGEPIKPKDKKKLKIEARNAAEAVGLDNQLRSTDPAGDLTFAQDMLDDKVGRMDRVDEANIPAPAPNKKGPDGKSQFAAKSGFNKNKPEGQQNYRRLPVSVPADAEPKKGSTGTGADAREFVDVRDED